MRRFFKSERVKAAKLVVMNQEAGLDPETNAKKVASAIYSARRRRAARRLRGA
jgi:hypothetical protein